jgi:hypothetical protein
MRGFGQMRLIALFCFPFIASEANVYISLWKSRVFVAIKPCVLLNPTYNK